jgi:hypothetical protein
MTVYFGNNNNNNNEWHYNLDGHKLPLIWFIAEVSAYEEQVANLIPQHDFESA